MNNIQKTVLQFKDSLTRFSLHNDEERKKYVTVMLLIAGTTAAIIFLAQDLAAWNTIEIGIDVSIIVLFSIFAILLLKTDRIKLLSRLSVGTLAVGLLSVTYIDVGHGSKFFLLLVFPQVYHTILGNKEGGIWNIVTLLLIFFILGFHSDQLGTSPASFKTRYVIAYLCVSAVAFIQEKIRELYSNKLLSERNELLQLNRKIKRMSITDKLTGLYNRAYLEKYIEKEFKKARRFRNDLSIAVCDLDHFKKVNDRFGHQAGDKVLAEVAAILSTCLRVDIDWVARYGGEEFLIVLPNTGRASAIRVLERIRLQIAGKEITWGNKRITVTASFGITSIENNRAHSGLSHELMIRQADKALYDAKNNGRNRTCFYNDFV